MNPEQGRLAARRPRFARIRRRRPSRGLGASSATSGPRLWRPRRTGRGAPGPRRSSARARARRSTAAATRACFNQHLGSSSKLVGPEGAQPTEALTLAAIRVIEVENHHDGVPRGCSHGSPGLLGAAACRSPSDLVSMPRIVSLPRKATASVTPERFRRLGEAGFPHSLNGRSLLPTRKIEERQDVLWFRAAGNCQARM